MSSDDEWADLFGESKKPKPAEQTKPVQVVQQDSPTVQVQTPPQIPIEPTPVVQQQPQSQPQPQPQATVAPPSDMKITEAVAGPQVVLVIYGAKGSGKTYATFAMEGRVFCLSFDKKSVSVKTNFYKNDPRIKVYDAIMYWNESDAQTLLESSVRTFEYILKLLDLAKKEQPDWVVIDGLEVEQQICEMTMRARNNVMPFAGVANRNLWKERNMYMRQIHNAAMSACKKGLIYTTYLQNEPEYKDGEIIKTTPIPKWADIVHRESDVVVRVYVEQEKQGRKFYGVVESSKVPQFATGFHADITGVGLRGLVKA